MKHNIFFYSAIFLLAVSLAIPSFEHTVFAQEVAFQEDFEDGQAQDWELEPGWQVIQDNGNYVLAGQGHTWARLPQAEQLGTIESFESRISLLAGSIHVNYRLGRGGSRYFVRLEQGGLSLLKSVIKQPIPQQGDPFDHVQLSRQEKWLGFGTWHTLRIVGIANRIEVYMDDELQIEYTDDDNSYLGGSVAFETLGDSRALVDSVVLKGQPLPSSPPGLTWTFTGGPLGGLGYDVRMRPDDPDVMFVTDAWSGIFTSTNGGRTWFPSSQGITTRIGNTGDGIPVFSLTIDPSNPDIVWAGTLYQRGIFKSIDGSRTWTRMVNGIVEADGISFRGFTIDPTNSDIVYAAAEISSWTWFGQPRQGREFDMTGGVVYKTTDGGESWNAIWRGDNLARYIWIDPRDTDVIYVSTGIFDREAANSDPVVGISGGVGILKSTDGGQTWTQVNNGLGNLYVGTLFMHPKNPDILLAGTGNVQYQEGGGAYLSNDGGMTWKHTLSSIFTESVEFAVSNPEIAYAGDAYGIYRSEDGGQTWKLVSGNGEADNRFGWGSPGVRGGHPIDFQVDPRNPDRIYVNAYGGGNFLSEDGGRTWIDTSKGYTGALTRDIVVEPSEPGRVIAAGRSGIFVSYNGGNDWEGLNYPELFSSEWEAVAIDPQNPQHLLASNNWTNALANSTNGGYAWHIVKDLGGNVGWRIIAFAPSNPAIIYAGSAGYFSAGAFDDQVPGYGIYVSRDGGRTWSSANDSSTQDAHVISLAINPGNPDILYAATSNRGLLMTIDAGATWTELPPLSQSTYVTAIALQPENPNTLYAGLWAGGFHRSTDQGQTWQQISMGLPPEARITDIVFNPSDPRVMYISDLFSGVYRSLDGGQTWSVINNGLLMRSVNALAISSDGLHLYAATEGGGVYRLDLNGQPPASMPGPETGAPTQTESQPASAATETGPTPAPTSPGNLPCGSAFLPLFLFGSLVWISRRKSIL